MLNIEKKVSKIFVAVAVSDLIKIFSIKIVICITIVAEHVKYSEL